MLRLADTLRSTRESAGLSTVDLARLLECDRVAIERAEAGDTPGAMLLDDYARIFGLSVRGLLRGDAEDGSAALLFRSMVSAGSALDDVIEVKLHRLLGEFLQCVSAVAELRAMLGDRPESSMSAWPSPEPLPHPRVRRATIRSAEDLAKFVRRAARLEEAAPIPSALDFVRERYNVDVYFLDPETMPRTIDGVSAVHPTPAILVNLIGGVRVWWRARMTIMHELFHLLFDRGVLEQSHGRRKLVLFSPELSALRDRHWHIVDRFDDMEQRANAFAAFMLAPSAGVERIVGHDEPSGLHVRAICETYGVGLETALNRMQDVCHLSDAERKALGEESRGTVPKKLEPLNRISPENIGLRPPWFAELVLNALSRDLIDEVEARRLMGLRLDEALADRPAIRPRWRDAMDVAVDYVQRHLQGVYAAERPSERPDGGFDVEVHRVLADGNQHLGVLHLTSSLKVREPVSWIQAAD